MALKKLDLLTLLISLFILTGCENPNGIGLDIDPDLALNSDTLTLNVETRLQIEDSIATNFTERSVLAHIKDTRFGTTTANMALAVTLPIANVSFGTNPQLDSAVLVLPYTASALYGDSAVYKADVRQLGEVLYSEPQKVYYSNKSWTTGTVIGTKSFKPSYKDSLKINVYGEVDSTAKVIPQLRIALNNSFILNNIVNLDAEKLTTSKKFADSFKGLYVSLDQTATPTNGGAIAFDTNTSGSAKVDIYYRTTNSDGGIDTLIKSFPIIGASGAAVTEIKWTPSTEVQTQLNSSNPNKLFLKGFAGTKVKVSVPANELNKLKAATFKNLAINRAELIFTAEDPTQSSLLPLSLLRVYKWDIADQPILVPDENPADARYLGFIGGAYNKTKKNYVINLTGYVQDLLKGRNASETFNGVFINTYDLINQKERLNFPGSVITDGGSSTSPNKVKLKIYYTDLK